MFECEDLLCLVWSRLNWKYVWSLIFVFVLFFIRVFGGSIGVKIESNLHNQRFRRDKKERRVDWCSAFSFTL